MSRERLMRKLVWPQAQLFKNVLDACVEREVVLVVRVQARAGCGKTRAGANGSGPRSRRGASMGRVFFYSRSPKNSLPLDCRNHAGSARSAAPVLVGAVHAHGHLDEVDAVPRTPPLRPHRAAATWEHGRPGATAARPQT